MGGVCGKSLEFAEGLFQSPEKMLGMRRSTSRRFGDEQSNSLKSKLALLIKGKETLHSFNILHFVVSHLSL